jgi:hypothetical protein
MQQSGVIHKTALLEHILPIVIQHQGLARVSAGHLLKAWQIPPKQITVQQIITG